MKKLSEEQQGTLVRILPDLPVSDGTGQGLEFEGPARSLAELIWNPDRVTPFTVVVHGGWGQGKTDLLRQTRSLLDAPQSPAGARKVHTLWFNPWNYPDDHSVQAGLLGALLDQFRRGSLLDRLGFQVDSHHSLVARRLLHAAAPWAFGKPAARASRQDRHGAVDEVRARNDLFRDLFLQASYLLVQDTAALRDAEGPMTQALRAERIQRNSTLAVFLEDLDRCRQDRLLEVVGMIELFSDLPGVSFFLDLDCERLLDLLSDGPAGYRAAFLEKVVQVSPNPPGISEICASAQRRSLIRDSCLNEVLRGEGFDDIEALADVLGDRHPRHVRRFLDNLSRSLAMLRNSGCLGDRPGQLRPRVVVAWHLLLERLPPERALEVRALSSNLEGFLRRRQASAETENLTEIHRTGSEGLIQPSLEGNQHHLVQTLLALSPQQLDLLVHAASPPREVPAGYVVTQDRPRKSFVGSVFTGLEWVKIPAGSFAMGSDQGRDNERPVHGVTLAGFHIARYLVTNAQYAHYVAATDVHPPQHWRDGEIPEGREDHPVVFVSWREALGFCDWLGEKMAEKGQSGRVQLPSEAEWEYAARGLEGRDYPWGNEAPDKGRCNFNSHVNDTTPVGAYPEGATPQGVHDLAGNVWEWTRSKWEKYPYPTDEKKRDRREALSGDERRVLRGCSFRYSAWYVRCTCRGNSHPGGRHARVGFRVVVCPSLSQNDAASEP